MVGTRPLCKLSKISDLDRVFDSFQIYKMAQLPQPPQAPQTTELSQEEIRQSLKPLEDYQRVELLKLLEPQLAPQKSFRYGDVHKRSNNEHFCRRSKAKPSWKNTIKDLEFPKDDLKLFHISYMLEYDVQLPDPKVLEVCHRCLLPNPQGKSLRNTGASCFVATHLVLRPHDKNVEMNKCHRTIRDFQDDNKNDKSVRTTGTLYVSDVAEHESNEQLKCKHNPPCFGNWGDISKKVE